MAEKPGAGGLLTLDGLEAQSGAVSHNGDVQVAGEVEDGAVLSATGTVTIDGLVGAATIKAADIVLKTGINGTRGAASLEATGTITAGFVEMCRLWAGKRIVSSSLINCQVECEGSVEVTGGKGLISGGKLTVLGSVVCNEVGNTSNVLTTISLGTTPKLMAERKRMDDQLEDVSAHLAKLKQDVAYVERLVADGRPVPPDRVQSIQRAKVALPLTERKKEQLEEQLARREEMLIAAVNEATLSAKMIHPPTKVSIGALSSNVIEQQENVRVYKSTAGVLSFGNLE